jgi:hypothetical protein
MCWRHCSTRWFKYDRDDLCVNKSQFVPVIFEPPCIFAYILASLLLLRYGSNNTHTIVQTRSQIREQETFQYVPWEYIIKYFIYPIMAFWKGRDMLQYDVEYIVNFTNILVVNFSHFSSGIYAPQQKSPRERYARSIRPGVHNFPQNWGFTSEF